MCSGKRHTNVHVTSKSNYMTNTDANRLLHKCTAFSYFRVDLHRNAPIGTQVPLTLQGPGCCCAGPGYNWGTQGGISAVVPRWTWACYGRCENGHGFLSPWGFPWLETHNPPIDKHSHLESRTETESRWTNGLGCYLSYQCYGPDRLRQSSLISFGKPVYLSDLVPPWHPPLLDGPSGARTCDHLTPPWSVPWRYMMPTRKTPPS